MSTYDLDSLVSRVKRVVQWSSISGSFTELDLAFYLEDATAAIQVDYPDFDPPVFTIGATLGASSIDEEVDIVDAMLMSLKAGFLVLEANYIEAIGDGVMIRAGSIALDTSKALKAHGLSLDFLKDQYDQLVQNLNIHGKSSDSSSIGTRVDNYINRYSDIGNEDSESLI